MLARVVQRSVVRRSVCAASAAVAGALSAPFRTVVPAALVASPLLSRSFSAAAAASTGGLHVLDESKTELSSLTKGKAIVYYTAAWCGPCKMIAPHFSALAKQYADKGINFVKIDVDDNEATASAANISAVPTFVAFDGGKVIRKWSGADQQSLTSTCETLAGSA